MPAFLRPETDQPHRTAWRLPAPLPRALQSIRTYIVKLAWLKDCQLQVENLTTGDSATHTLDAAGSLPVSIKHTPGFLFLKYTLKPRPLHLGCPQPDHGLSRGSWQFMDEALA